MTFSYKYHWIWINISVFKFNGHDVLFMLKADIPDFCLLNADPPAPLYIRICYVESNEKTHWWRTKFSMLYNFLHPVIHPVLTEIHPVRHFVLHFVQWTPTQYWHLLRHLKLDIRAYFCYLNMSQLLKIVTGRHLFSLTNLSNISVESKAKLV